MDTVLTGDTLLFSNNTPAGFLLRTFVSSEWTHSGIAVRFVDGPAGKTVSLTAEGELYVLETNVGTRRDEIYDVDTIGAGFSRSKRIFQKYNKIAVRRIHDAIRVPEFAERTLEFVRTNQNNRFPSSSLPFLSVWLGIELQAKSVHTKEMFCSELVAHYYEFTIGPIYEAITGSTSSPMMLSHLFGMGSPTSESMFTPGHYSSQHTPSASIFKGIEEVIFRVPADMLYVILQPLLIALVIMLAIWMSLPRASS